MNHENAVRPRAEADALKLVQSLRALDAKQLLQAAVERGLTFGDCINAFGMTPEESAFVSAAQAMPDDDIEFDDRSVVSRSERGAFVHCWHFVSNEAAGIPEPSVMLEALQYFAATHQGGGDPQLKAKYLALAQLMDVLGAEFDELEGTPREVVPSCFDLGNASLEMLPSRLVAELAATALDQGFSPVLAEALLNWIEHQGNLLDQLAAEMFVAAA